MARRKRRNPEPESSAKPGEIAKELKELFNAPVLGKFTLGQLLGVGLAVGILGSIIRTGKSLAS